MVDAVVNIVDNGASQAVGPSPWEVGHPERSATLRGRPPWEICTGGKENAKIQSAERSLEKT